MKLPLKHLYALVLVATLLVAPSCKTTQPDGGSVWADPIFVDKTALFLKATVANGVVLAVSEEDKAAAYCTLVREALAKLRAGDDYTPGAFEKALVAVPVNELQTKYAALVIANLSLAYELYWSQLVADNIAAHMVATKLIDAAIHGIDLGLMGNALPVPEKPVMSRVPMSRVYLSK